MLVTKKNKKISREVQSVKDKMMILSSLLTLDA